jgi:integrase
VIRRRGESLEVRVYAGVDANGKQRHLYATVRGTGRKAEREARQKAAVLEAQVAAGRLPAGKVTFDQLADEWLELARHDKSTRYQTERYLDRHVRPVLGKRRIEKIVPTDLNRLYLALEAGTAGHTPLAPATVLRIHGIIRACFELAVRNDWVSCNPAARASPPKQAQKDPESPDLETVVAILDTAYGMDQEMYVFIRLAAATGLRRGSICAIRWPDIDFRRRTLRHHKAIGIGKGGIYEKPTKSGTSHTMSLDRETVAVLRWHRLRMLVRSKELGGLDPNGFLFSAHPTCSEPWRPDHATKRYARIRAAAGAKTTLKKLRNFQATDLLSDGFDVKIVSRRLTHSRTSTTQDRYQAWIPDADRLAAEHIGLKLRRRR